MTTVDKVIYDALAKRRNVVLPGAGSLEVKRRKAKKVADDRIIPPQNVVTFVEDEIAEGDSVVYLLATEGEMSDKEAKETYRAWLKKARTDSGIMIEGVGEVRDGKFVIERGLHTELNPSEDEEQIVMAKDQNRGGPLWIWLVAGIVLAALVILFLFLNTHCFRVKKHERIEVITPVVPEPVVAEETSEDHIIETLKQSPVEPAFHIIVGSFAVESNADSYAAKLQKQFPELAVQKIRSSRTNNWLVSIFSAPTERQAYNKMNLYWDISLDLWVYEQK